MNYEVYPQVKIRNDGDPVGVEEDGACLVRDFDFMSLQDPCSAGSNGIGHSPPLAKVPESYIPIAAIPTVSTPKVKTNRTGISDQRSTSITLIGKGKEIGDDTRLNIRAGSVPPPRAVLSSPDNDGMIGSRNRLSREKQMPLRKQGLSASPLAQAKVVKLERKEPSPLSNSGTMKDGGDKSHLATKPGRTGRILRETGNQSQNRVKQVTDGTTRKPRTNSGKGELGQLLKPAYAMNPPVYNQKLAAKTKDQNHAATSNFGKREKNAL